MSNVSQLDYAPPQRWLRRRWKRVALVSLLFLITAILWLKRRDIEGAYQRFAMLQTQQRCLQFQPDQGRVAYEEDLAKVNELLDHDRDYVPVNVGPDDAPHTIALWCPTWIRDYPALRGNYGLRGRHYKGPGALLFLHERTTPGGRRVLVCVEAYVRHEQPTTDIGIHVSVIQPGTGDAPPKHIGGHLGILVYVGDIAPSRPLRIFAGRPDPADPSHYTVEYEIQGKRGIVDGRITDNPDPSSPVLSTFEERYETVKNGARR
jgi:hypothetical protein